MIDLRDLRADPDKYRSGARDKLYDPELIDRLLAVDEQYRAVQTERETLAAEKNRLSAEIGKLMGRLKQAKGDEKQRLEAEAAALRQRPTEIKAQEQELEERLPGLRAERDALWLEVPLPADPEVPVGASDEDNVQLSTWNPNWFDPAKPFAENKGFEPKSHIDLGLELGLVDFERGVRMSGARNYVLTGLGMELHQAVLRMAFEFMISENGFTAMSVPVVVRDQTMVGTGFFPSGIDQAYQIANPTSDTGDMYLTGTGEVGLMAIHMDEILDEADLPLTYTTVSTCFRREAGAHGRDTAGLFRIHQFDKVEQVVICAADEAESRRWHQKMIDFVEVFMQRLELPYRLLELCTADLGAKTAAAIDIEAWMPSRGPLDDDGRPLGAYGETHTASRLYDYQTRRLNLRYRTEDGRIVFPHALNNTVAASPRILIPIIEMYQTEDGTITVPTALRPYLGGRELIG